MSVFAVNLTSCLRLCWTSLFTIYRCPFLTLWFNGCSLETYGTNWTDNQTGLFGTFSEVSTYSVLLIPLVQTVSAPPQDLLSLKLIFSIHVGQGNKHRAP